MEQNAARVDALQLSVLEFDAAATDGKLVMALDWDDGEPELRQLEPGCRMAPATRADPVPARAISLSSESTYLVSACAIAIHVAVPEIASRSGTDATSRVPPQI